MQKRNVLIFPMGAVSSCDIYQSLKYYPCFEVFGISIREEHAQLYLPEQRLRVSPHYMIKHEKLWESFLQILQEWNIHYIIPTHDTVARYLMEHQHKIPATVVCSPLETARIAEDKLLTYQALGDCWYYPRVYAPKEEINFPVFLKPHVAAGGKGCVKANNREALEQALAQNPDLLICEYLPGEEYTIDCFTNSKRELLFAGARSRGRITDGITFSSNRVPMTPELRKIAEDLNARISFRGAWYFQVKENAAGDLRLMEFSVRQAGTMSYYRQLGVNFAALSLFDLMGEPVRVICNDLDMLLDRGTETLYHINYDYDTLYLAHDDTLIVDNQVNTDLMQLIYQSINRNIKVVLLTTHMHDLEASLAAHKLHTAMFDEIILLEPNSPKADYIKHERAIFVGHDFADRQNIASVCAIPVFDLDAVECLIDKSGM